jgi:signal transduction histidine kinase
MQSAVYGFVKQNNGFINAYSEMERGTIFSIYLPRVSGDEQGMK